MSKKDEKHEQLAPQAPPLPDKQPKKRTRSAFSPAVLRLIGNLFYKNPLIWFFIVILAAAICFRLFIAPSIGTSAGLAMGSWRGVTQGLAEGAENGTEAGLSAQDIEANIVNKMTVSGNLQVLLVDLRLTDLYQHGNDYAALFAMKSEGVFSVDLTQSQVTYSEAQNEIIITIPKPVFSHYFDDNDVEKLAEYTRPLFNGSTKNGYEGYLNSRAQIEQRIQSELVGYDEMVKQAEDSALTQVELLAKSVSGSNASVTVQFVEGEGQADGAES